MKTTNSLYLILMGLVLISSCQVQGDRVSKTLVNQNQEMCYISVSQNNTDVNAIVATNISNSIINKFVRKVRPMPSAGLSAEFCLVEVSISKDNNVIYSSINSSDFNAFGESNFTGGEGVKLSLLSSILKNKPEQKNTICQYANYKLLECSGINRVTTLYYDSGQIKYKGGTKNSLFEGEGTYLAENGNTIYKGEWSKGKYHGKGELFWKNGNIRLRGKWVKGQPSGIMISFWWDENKKSTEGKKKKLDCYRTPPDFPQDEEECFYDNGNVVQYYKNGGIRFQGYAVFNPKENIDDFDGKYYTPDGILTCDCRGNINGLQGNGKEYYESGDYYEGNFFNGKYDGFGKFFKKQLNNWGYVGNWKQGAPSGSGKEMYPNGDYFEGYFINGKGNGNGKFFFKNGNIYEGGFKDNMFHGNGRYIFRDGSLRVGTWKNNQEHGDTRMFDTRGNFMGIQRMVNGVITN